MVRSGGVGALGTLYHIVLIAGERIVQLLKHAGHARLHDTVVVLQLLLDGIKNVTTMTNDTVIFHAAI